MYATYAIKGSNIFIDYTSASGESLLGERVILSATFKGDPQQVAYNHASVRASTHGLRLEALRRAA